MVPLKLSGIMLQRSINKDQVVLKAAINSKMAAFLVVIICPLLKHQYIAQ